MKKLRLKINHFFIKIIKSNQEGKFHLKLIINSKELKKLNRIEKNKKIYKVLDKELKEYIHSIQILIN